MAFSAGCDMDADGGDKSSESTVCNMVGTSWWNQSFTEEAGTFHVDFAATPSARNIDAVVGLSSGAASKWASLAAIVRFNPQGTIDARNGSTYTALQSWPYEAGVTYFVRIEVDVQRHTYSAWASYQAGDYNSSNQIASNYAFRTEQAAISKLSNLSAFVNPETGAGTLQVCGFALNRLPQPGSKCIGTNAGGAFVNVATAPGINNMIVDVQASASEANIDGVVGVSLGEADAYNDFATSIRFWTNGQIEVRNGDVYTNMFPLSYSPGVTYSFKFVIDLSNKMYSVYVFDPERVQFFEIARNYRFRPQQMTVTKLDHVAAVVASPTGHVDACAPQNSARPELIYSYWGAYVANTAPNDGVIISDTRNTKVLDATGKVVTTVPTWGAPTTDSAGNIYVAYGATPMTVASYTAAGALRWTRALPDNGFAQRIAVTTSGRILVSAYVNAYNDERVYYVAADGSTSGIVHTGLPGSVVLGPTGYALTAPLSDGTQFESHDPFGNIRWNVAFHGDFQLTALDLGPDGSFVFGGQFFGSAINFGDKTLYGGGGEDGPRNAFIVALSPTGQLRFSERLPARSINGLATNGSRIAVALDDVTQFSWVSTQVYSTSGQLVRSWLEQGFGLGNNGGSYAVSMTSSGRVIARINARPFGLQAGDPVPYVLALQP